MGDGPCADSSYPPGQWCGDVGADRLPWVALASVPLFAHGRRRRWAPVKPFPAWLADLARRALLDAYGDANLAASYAPDVALVNFYEATARLGMHQDKDERSDAPVVSLSLGDTCVFRLGNTADRGKPYTDIDLVSGDLFVFGGPSRFAYHGVPRVHPGTGDPRLGLTGRL